MNNQNQIQQSQPKFSMVLQAPKVQNLINNKVNSDYNVLVIGNNNHPETMCYLGISNKVSLFDKEKNYSRLNKVFVINQTTLIYEDVLKFDDDIFISFFERQEELQERLDEQKRENKLSQEEWENCSKRLGEAF